MVALMRSLTNKNKARLGPANAHLNDSNPNSAIGDSEKTTKAGTRALSSLILNHVFLYEVQRILGYLQTNGILGMFDFLVRASPWFWMLGCVQGLQ